MKIQKILNDKEKSKILEKLNLPSLKLEETPKEEKYFKNEAR